MRYKYFILRIVNLLLILGLLGAYQIVLCLRAKDEKITSLQTQINQLEGEKNAVLEEKAGDSGERSEADANVIVYKDGRYSGTADGFGGAIEVSVKIENQRIASIEIASAKQEDEAYLSMASGIIDEMVEWQTAEVDTVSGATYSSAGIKNAVKNALEKAVD